MARKRKTFYVIAKLARVSGGYSLRFYTGKEWGTIAQYSQYASQSIAARIAKSLNCKCVVAPSTTSTKRLINLLQGKA